MVYHCLLALSRILGGAARGENNLAGSCLLRMLSHKESLLIFLLNRTALIGIDVHSILMFMAVQVDLGGLSDSIEAHLHYLKLPS